MDNVDNDIVALFASSFASVARTHAELEVRGQESGEKEVGGWWSSSCHSAMGTAPYLLCITPDIDTPPLPAIPCHSPRYPATPRYALPYF